MGILPSKSSFQQISTTSFRLIFLINYQFFRCCKSTITQNSQKMFRDSQTYILSWFMTKKHSNEFLLTFCTKLFFLWICIKKIFALFFLFDMLQKTLGLLRSDYLAHSHFSNSIKQVEINTIASSFGGISSKTLRKLHR